MSGLPKSTPVAGSRFRAGVARPRGARYNGGVIRRSPTFLALLALLSQGAWGQLDLPFRPKPRPSGGAPVIRPPDPPRGDLAPRPGTEPVLDLPGAPAPPEVAPPTPLGPTEAVIAPIFAELERQRGAAEATLAVERLLAAGPEVLPFARARLGSNHLPTLLAAARVCLVAGESADRAAVAERLTRPLPAEAGGPLLAELLQRDPKLASPEYLAGLLEHPGSALRGAAARALEERLANVPLNVLAPPLDSPRGATRTLALELVARVDDPLAWNLIASRFADSSAQIARRATELLAAKDGAEGMLLERAFPAGAQTDLLPWDRARAYALLAVVEREEGTGRTLLEGPDLDARIEDLRLGLASSQPLVVGACAVALARMGFRASARHAGPWLEREVPHQLVRCGTGAEFHPDFSSLERPSLRALTLLTGQAFGPDGEAWRRWWTENSAHFKARHAVMEVSPEAARDLLVRFRDGRGLSWCLIGPEREAPSDDGSVLRLDTEAADRLRGRLEAYGVFGAERLPSVAAGGACDLGVEAGDQEKRFVRTAGGGDVWLEELGAELEDCVEENRWQRLFDPSQTDAETWWRSERARWKAYAPLERRRELVGLLLASARRSNGAKRDGEILELVRLYDEPGVPAPADFEPLLALLADEPAFGPRAERLIGLARVSAGTKGSEAGESAPRERLIELGLARFGAEADESLARVARDLDTASLEVLARQPSPRARALAAAGLARAPDRLELARALLTDSDPTVVLAALRTLGQESVLPSAVAELRAELLVLVRGEALEPRMAALAVLARLGGKDVHDLALEALADDEERVQAAGVAALAQLADARDASLLSSLLARGPGSPLYADARRGLERMGAPGLEECSRLARSTSGRARREAALLLSEALVPEAAGLLLTLLAEAPGDERVRWELCVLAGLDFGADPHPERAAAAWWELVKHDDAGAWLMAAAERVGVPAPERGLGAELDASGAHFLLSLAERPEPFLVERATRELERRLGFTVVRPERESERAAFQAELREAVRARLER